MKLLHTPLLIIGVFILLVVAACGGQTSNHQTDNFVLQVTGTKLTPNSQLTAHAGDTINLTITADKQEEIHLHGYDFHFYLKPGQKQTKTFTADKTGAFEIEIEDSNTHLGELDVMPQ